MSNTFAYAGACRCGSWTFEAVFSQPVSALTPRRCGCDYCRAYPSLIVSDPDMRAQLRGGEAFTRDNGDRLATFYYCRGCEDLLAIGCSIEGELRGALNAGLLSGTEGMRDATLVQPRVLDAAAKVKRWGALWGVLSGL